MTRARAFLFAALALASGCRAGAGGGGTSGAGGSGGGSGGATDAAGAGGAAGGGAGGAIVADAAVSDPCAARAGLLFCDDFEGASPGAALSAPPWSTELNGGGTVTVVDSAQDASSPAHSGRRSVRVNGTGFDTLFVLHDPAILPAPGGRFFVRLYMRLDAPMTPDHNTFVIADPFAMQGTGNNVRVGEMAGMLMSTVMADAHGALSNNNYYNDGKPGVVFAPGAWTCLEILLDHGKPEIDVWVDGVEVPDLHHTDWPLDDYDSLRFGFERYAGPDSVIWYDDVAVGTARVGCE